MGRATPLTSSRTANACPDEQLTVPNFWFEDASTLSVLVGPAEHQSIVHEKLLTTTSNYFRDAMNANLKEAQDRTFLLTDLHPGLFAVFVHWAYYRRIDIAMIDALFGPSSPHPNFEQYANALLADIDSRYPKLDLPTDVATFWTQTPEDRTWMSFFMLYVLGDRLQSSHFKNAIINTMLSWMDLSTAAAYKFRLSSCQGIRYAFENTYLNCGLRQLLVDVTFYEASSTFLKSHFCAAQHREFVIELGQMFAEHAGVQGLGKAPKYSGAAFIERNRKYCAAYHEHPAEKVVNVGECEEMDEKEDDGIAARTRFE